MQIENVKITDINTEGNGVGRAANYEKVLFVKDAITGEEVTVELTKEEKTFAKAKVLKRTATSNQRVTPVCKHFGICGGCQLQHISYPHQLEVKQNYVKTSITKIGKVEGANILPIVPSFQQFGYRGKMDYAFSCLPWFTEGVTEEKRVLGFHISGRFERVLNIEECHLNSGIVNKIRNFIREFAISKNTTFWDQKKREGVLRSLLFKENGQTELAVIIIFGTEPRVFQAELCMALKNTFPEITSLFWGVNKKESDATEGVKLFAFKGEEKLTYNFAGLTFFASLKGFMQINNKMIEEFVGRVLNFANVTKESTVYDLYSGIGTFSLPIALLSKKVIGIEVSTVAVQDAKYNTRYNNIENVKFFKGKVEDILTEGFILENGKPDVLIADPPRSGIEGKALNKVIEVGAESLIYISCNPASFARDLLTLKNHYKLESVLPIDMFPQTTHVELIAKFTKL